MLPWAEMFRAALHRGLSPDAFWRLSLREWRWLADADGEALGRSDLAALIARFPDAQKPEDHHD